MPDISMCRNSDCPLKETCYRFKAIPFKHWQAYGLFAPDKNGNCEHYWHISEQQKDRIKTKQ